MAAVIRACRSTSVFPSGATNMILDVIPQEGIMRGEIWGTWWPTQQFLIPRSCMAKQSLWQLVIEVAQNVVTVMRGGHHHVGRWSQHCLLLPAAGVATVPACQGRWLLSQWLQRRRRAHKSFNEKWHRRHWVWGNHVRVPRLREDFHPMWFLLVGLHQGSCVCTPTCKHMGIHIITLNILIPDDWLDYAFPPHNLNIQWRRVSQLVWINWNYTASPSLMQLWTG
jgi:hypothetical protein